MIGGDDAAVDDLALNAEADEDDDGIADLFDDRNDDGVDPEVDEVGADAGGCSSSRGGGGGSLAAAALVDLSSSGLRIERPYDPVTASGPVQLEIELPGIDEILWAKGHVTFLRLWRGSNAHGRPRYWCRTGIRIERAAGRDRRLIRDYVHAFIPRVAN